MAALKRDIGELEREFVRLRSMHKAVTQMSELMRLPEVERVLREIADRKKKINKIEYAIKDTLAENTGSDEK